MTRIVGNERLRSVVFALFHAELMLFLTIVAITNFIRIRADADMREAQSESQLAEARLRRLRGDLQSHFLFNTLNAVATLIHTDPTAARATIATLLDLLRSTFELTRAEVPLGEELDFASRYLELQKIRFGDRLHASIDVSDPALLSAAIRTLIDRSQLDRMRTQLHFVFTTLQATSDVLEHDPAAADAMVVGLSDLLRRSLAAGDEDVPLSNELEMIDRYLELHRMGPGNDVVVTLDVEEDVLNAAVPPMSLLPLVEHAVALAGEGEVHLCGRREGATLRLDIRYPSTAASVAVANTIDLTRARLRQLYADRQSFDVSTVHPFVIIAVRIPFRHTAARESETA